MCKTLMFRLQKMFGSDKIRPEITPWPEGADLVQVKVLRTRVAKRGFYMENLTPNLAVPYKMSRITGTTRFVVVEAEEEDRTPKHTIEIDEETLRRWVSYGTITVVSYLKLDQKVAK